jgi:hypothetical protein
MNEQQTAILIRDFVSNFTAIRSDARAYVDARYDWMSDKQKEEKIAEVIERKKMADNIRALSDKIGTFVVAELEKEKESED